jgi:hypothetical protein
MEKIRDAFTLGKDVWDPSHRFETSWFLPPWVLFAIRATVVSILIALLSYLTWRSPSAPAGAADDGKDDFERRGWTRENRKSEQSKSRRADS